MPASNVSKTAFILQTTLSIAKSYLALYRSIEGALQSTFRNINDNDSCWNTSVDETTNTYYSLVTEALTKVNLLVSLLQDYLSNQTSSDNEFIYRIPVVTQLQSTNNVIMSLLEIWKNIMPLSSTENNSINQGKFQNWSIEHQKIHFQNKLFLANSIQVTLTTTTVLFGTVDKSEGTFVSNLHIVLFENFIDNAHLLYTSIIESTDELDSLIHNQTLYGTLITSFTAVKYVSVSESICSSFRLFQSSIENILNELSK